MPRTEGQRALRLVPGTISAIASAIGVDKGTVSRWRSGEKLPDGPRRQRMHALYAIAPEAWDRIPLGSEPTASSAPTVAPDTANAPLPSALEDTLALIAELKTFLKDGKLSTSERKGALDNLSKLLALRARLEEKGDMLEARIVREHPRWRDIVNGLPDVLRPYPLAAEAVATWLAELDDA